MPAIVTHYCFGEDAIQAHSDVCGSTRDECDAFLLGNQGPDPLFFIRAPEPFGTIGLARAMHSEKPAQLLAALKQALDALPENEQPIGRAYAHGFLCHYLLDSIVHPLVYATVDTICEAGIDGLSSSDKSVVHDYIEREWDEMVLTVKYDTTIASFNPTTTLRASERVLEIVQKLFSFMALGVYGIVIDTNAYVRAVAAYRIARTVMHSPTGVKRFALGFLEETLRSRSDQTHSRLLAFAPRPVRVESTWLANPNNDPWVHPFTGEARNESFWDLYTRAQDAIEDTMRTFDNASFDEEAARALTNDINFRGAPTVTTLTVHA